MFLNLERQLKFYLLIKRKEDAQLDICIGVLLDPLNPEIPGVISRIFLNQNLIDVLKSPQMKKAQEFLKPFPNVKFKYE